MNFIETDSALRDLPVGKLIEVDFERLFRVGPQGSQGQGLGAIRPMCTTHSLILVKNCSLAFCRPEEMQVSGKNLSPSRFYVVPRPNAGMQ